eukprot:UN05395
MESMHPYYKAGKTVIGGIHDPYEGDIDPSQLTIGTCQKVREPPVQKSPVSPKSPGSNAIRTTNGKSATSQGTVTCETIVNASGFYGNQVAGLP